MTYYKMPKQPIDDQKSTEWASAFLNSVGCGAKKKGGAIFVFDLVNWDTYRAHRMSFIGGGKAKGLPVTTSVLNSAYVRFSTKKPASFSDFNHKRAKLKAKDRVGYSWRTLKVYDGLAELMEVHINNWNPTSGISSKGRE